MVRDFDYYQIVSEQKVVVFDVLAIFLDFSPSWQNVSNANFPRKKASKAWLVLYLVWLTKTGCFEPINWQFDVNKFVTVSGDLRRIFQICFQRFSWVENQKLRPVYLSFANLYAGHRIQNIAGIYSILNLVSVSRLDIRDACHRNRNQTKTQMESICWSRFVQIQHWNHWNHWWCSKFHRLGPLQEYRVKGHEDQPVHHGAYKNENNKLDLKTNHFHENFFF